MQFFLVTLIFLIFDVELIILFPFLLSTLSELLTLNYFILILSVLSAGFVWEWAQGMLKWKSY